MPKKTSKKLEKDRQPLEKDRQSNRQSIEESSRNNTASYEAKDIYVLEGLEPVRRRPGMYIGSTGPDGLHHLIWECVDNSVSYETPVMIKNQGEIRIQKIGRLIDELFEKNANSINKSTDGEAEILREGFKMEALSFDPNDLKLKFQPIFSLIRHKVNSELFKITLQNGRQIEITPYHSLFTLKDGQVLPIKGSDLKVGFPIVVPKIWPEVESPIREIDLIDEFLKLPATKTESLHLYNIKNLLTEDLYQKLKPVLKEKAEKTQVQHSSNIFYDYKRWNYLPFNLLRKLQKEEIAKFKDRALIGTRYNEKIRLKPKLEISRELVELLGIFAAEGSIVKNKGVLNRVVFGLGAKEKDLINYLCSLIEKVFEFKPQHRYVHKTARTIAIDSYLVTLIFKEIFKTGENSSNKIVPNLIFNLDRKLRERYLIGYLAGDGYPTKVWTSHLVKETTPSELERRKFSAVTKNKDLAVTLSYLLSSLNKTYSLRTVFRKKDQRFIFVNYKNKIRKSEFQPTGKTFRIDFYWNTNSSYFNYLPTREVISRVFWQRPYSFSLNTQGGVSVNKVLSLLERQRIILYPPAFNFLSSDLGILRVRKIEKIKYNHPWVYDISVPNGENFVGGLAPVCLKNSIDEAMAGYAKNIKVEILKNNQVAVTDDGRGIPVDIHPQTKKSALETVMCTLHAGGKFGGESYKVAGGLHGVGVSVVNALSKWMRVEVCRDGNLYSQEYQRGRPKYKVKKEGKCQGTGTKVIFDPDPEIFPKIEFDRKRILDHLRQQAFLTKGIKIEVIDYRPQVPFYYSFYFEGGLLSFINYLNRTNQPIQKEIFYVQRTYENIEVEVAFIYNQEVETQELSFANNIYTPDGGMHLTGFRSALTRTLNDYARTNGYLKNSDENLIGDDVREGLVAIVSVKLREPQFEGQTKARLGNPPARTAVEAVVNESLREFLEKNSNDARAIIEKCLLTAKARKAAKAAKETVLRKGVFEGMTLPGKLADCSSRNPEESELFIVEGDSAGGSAKSARDRRFQAILPLRGKILNVEKARVDKMLLNKEIRALVLAIGTAIGDEFDLTKLRYHRIIIATDADVDGAHIRTLLLTLFYRYFTPVIENGHLYIAQPPLYRIQAGKEVKYAYNEAEKERIINEISKAQIAKRKANENESKETISDKRLVISIQRYKGLGEMNPEQLWETTMDKEKRILKQVTIEDAQEAERLFDILMGEQVEPRKHFIQSQATMVKNLDI